MVFVSRICSRNCSRKFSRKFSHAPSHALSCKPTWQPSGPPRSRSLHHTLCGRGRLGYGMTWSIQRHGDMYSNPSLGRDWNLTFICWRFSTTDPDVGKCCISSHTPNLDASHMAEPRQHLSFISKNKQSSKTKSALFFYSVFCHMIYVYACTTR